jgi:predicted amidohydrolase YtcJ
MTIFHGTFLDVPESPFTGGTLRTADALLVRDGVIAARGRLAELRHSHPGEQPVDLTAGLVLPGLVDTHVHFSTGSSTARCPRRPDLPMWTTPETLLVTS